MAGKTITVDHTTYLTKTLGKEVLASGLRGVDVTDVTKIDRTFVASDSFGISSITQFIEMSCSGPLSVSITPVGGSATTFIINGYCILMCALTSFNIVNSGSTDVTATIVYS